MTRIQRNVAVALVALGGICPGTWADGGAVRFDGQCGGYRIVAFSQPTPVRVGWVDLSVLVQNAKTGDTLRGAAVTIELTRKNAGLQVSRPATQAAATNKMLRAAGFALPQPGIYDVCISVDGSLGTATGEFELYVLPAMPRWLSLWPWLFWPVVPIALYVWQAAAGVPRQRGASVASPTTVASDE